MWKHGLTIILLLAPTVVSAQLSDEGLFGADGYRIVHYRAPVPVAPDGVGRIAPAAVAQLRADNDVILIDVLPAEGAHRDEAGHWHLAKDRPSIPGAHWFPEAGRGAPAADVASWFERGVTRLTGGAKGRMIVTFCLADCWMSWNAARRLRAMGYHNVWWLAEGTDGWRDLGLPLTPVLPEGR
jgi:PQQ-dependent catabolism-associated CXXCW motif protein